MLLLLKRSNPLLDSKLVLVADHDVETAVGWLDHLVGELLKSGKLKGAPVRQGDDLIPGVEQTHEPKRSVLEVPV